MRGTNVVFLRVLFCVIAITCAWLVTAEEVCTYPLGMESGAIPDDSITASSWYTLSVGHEPYRGRLNGVAGVGAWAARTNTIGTWLQVDLGEMKTITGTIIQGRYNHHQWVTSYKLQYSVDGLSWITYASSDGSGEVFPGNTDRNTPVTNLLDRPTDARYVRFLPQSWDDHMSMRVEVLGCSVNVTEMVDAFFLLGDSISSKYELEEISHKA
ncbi:lactadherin-like [Branchiostoma floridae x Branchiostoma belcheri]